MRYCDDFVIFHDDSERLRATAAAVGEYLAGVRLRLHEGKLHTRPSREGLEHCA